MITPNEIYSKQILQLQTQLKALQNKSFAVSALRVVIFLSAALGVYQFIQTEQMAWIGLTLVALTLFLLVIQYHQGISDSIHLKKTLIEINEQELDFVQTKKKPKETGSNYSDINHPYADDIDLFGENSLYQFLNRTETIPGKLHLANNLKNGLETQEIIDTQEAVKECTDKIEWRQYLMALGRTQNDQEKSFHHLIEWSKKEIIPVPQWIRVLYYVLPLMLSTSLILYSFIDNEMYWKLASSIFTLNLILFSQWMKKIINELPESEKIHRDILKYGQLIKWIEQESFESEKMKTLQRVFIGNHQKVSVVILKLSKLFQRMDSIHNLVGATLFNGIGLYHLHILHAMNQWKLQHCKLLEGWLLTIGETECINSLANFSFNHPRYCFPQINNNYMVEFNQVGHPLINPSIRVDNDISFNKLPFVILTGSNMSGKSTFLRSLGMNMVLARMGAPVCALKANIHPLPIIMSMRLSDSLGENESFFFAEVKKLKHIIDQLSISPCFVLLDEILRGTNSDDKRNGTILFLEKLVRLKAMGVIATHDLEVCRTTIQYPEYLSNQCFEVDLSQNELHFDYILREGICQNKSATFLMHKMGII